MPTALNTPRSWTRSRVCSTTVFSTPSAATAASSSVIVVIRPMMIAYEDELRLFTITGSCWPIAFSSAFTYALRLVPGLTATSYWSGSSRGSTGVNVDRAPNISGVLPCGSKTSPAIVTVVRRPPEASA